MSEIPGPNPEEMGAEIESNEQELTATELAEATGSLIKSTVCTELSVAIFLGYATKKTEVAQMGENLGPSEEELGLKNEATVEDEASKEKERQLVLEVCRSYDLPDGYMEELEALDLEGAIGTATCWIAEEGHDLDEFLAKIIAPK